MATYTFATISASTTTHRPSTTAPGISGHNPNPTAGTFTITTTDLGPPASTTTPAPCYSSSTPLITNRPNSPTSVGLQPRRVATILRFSTSCSPHHWGASPSTDTSPTAPEQAAAANPSPSPHAATGDLQTSPSTAQSPQANQPASDQPSFKPTDKPRPAPPSATATPTQPEPQQQVDLSTSQHQPQQPQQATAPPPPPPPPLAPAKQASTDHHSRRTHRRHHTRGRRTTLQDTAELISPTSFITTPSSTFSLHLLLLFLF